MEGGVDEVVQAGGERKRSKKPYRNRPKLPEVAIRSVNALMTLCTGGQKKQEPKPNRMEKTTMQVKDQRLPE